jgi:hypothetical protein
MNRGMKPWDAEAIEWNERNERKLAGRHISPSEVHEVFQSDPEWAPNKRNRAGDWKMVGYTDAGRAITVIIRWHEARAVLEPITGWETTPGETTKYL